MGAQPEVLPVGLLEAAREVLLTGATQTTAEPQQSAGVQDTTRKLTCFPPAFARTSRQKKAAETNGTLPLPHSSTGAL